MKERPILFSAPMVRAILDGTKTQTRRAIKTPSTVTEYKHFEGLRWDRMQREQRGDTINCPYGQPSDRLWVRQEHYRFGHWEPVPGVRTKGNRQKWKFVADTDETLYEAPDEYRKGRHHKDPATPAWHKRLARFMPRRLSAIELEITDIRVERLQDISEADAIAEGIERGNTFPGWYRGHLLGDSPGLEQAGRAFKVPTAFPKLAYRALWESINGPGSWDANPWVWVVEFKRVNDV